MPLDIVTALSLPFIVFLGVITSYEDISSGQIRNKWILAALACSLLIILSVSSFYYFTGAGVNKFYIFTYTLNITFALIAGIIVWQLRLWNAADAKLFVAFAAIVPLTVYKTNYFFYFPAFNLLLNTLIVSFLFLVFGLLSRGSSKAKLQEAKNFFSLRNMLNVALFIFGFSWLIQALFSALSLPHNMFISLAMLLFLFPILRRIAQNHVLVLSLILSILHINFEFRTILAISFILHFLLVLAIFTAIRLVLHLSRVFYSLPVEIGKLMPGMRAAEQIVHDNATGKYMLQPSGQLFRHFTGESSHESGQALLKSPSLTEKAISRLKKLHKANKLGFNALRVHQTMPFAPMMFAGVLATLVVRGDVVSFVIGMG